MKIDNEFFQIAFGLVVYFPVLVFAIYYGIWGGLISSASMIIINAIIDFLLSGARFDTSILIGYYFTILLIGLVAGHIVNQKKKLDEIVKERELLLSEIHHRIKNNLSLITDMIRLEIRNLEDKSESAGQALSDLEKRIESIGLIHEKLYSNDSLSKIDYYDYVKSLTNSIISGMVIDPDNIKVYINIIKIDLSVDTIIPLGIIITELVTNAIKYGFKKTDKGEIKIMLIPQNKGYLLEVANNGNPLPLNFNLEVKTLGMKIIQSLAKQLGGKLQFENDPEVKFSIKILEQI